MLRPLGDEKADVELKEFMDPTLRHNKMKYQRLIAELHRGGLVRPFWVMVLKK